MVYIELLLLEDLIYNYVIILTVSILLTRITSIKKIIISSVFGSLSLIILPYHISGIVNIFVSIIFSILVSLIAFSYKGILYTIKNIFYMYISTIFIAGFIYLINTHFFNYINNYLFKVITLLIISPIITFIYLKSIIKLKNNCSNYYKVDIYIDENTIIKVTGFLDTGNKLIDPYKYRPIILIKKNLIQSQKKILLVPYKTISNESLLECIIPKQIYIHNVGYKNKFLLGLVEEINIEGAECILHQKLLERI